MLTAFRERIACSEQTHNPQTQFAGEARNILMLKQLVHSASALCTVFYRLPCVKVIIYGPADA